MSVSTYNLKKVILIVAGVPIEGFGETDAISIARDEDAWAKTVGADGEVVRSKTNNDSGSVTITTMYTSVANTILKTALSVDELSGDRTFPMVIADLNHQWQWVITDAWVKKHPDVGMNKQVSECSWVIDCAHMSTERLLDDWLDTFGGRPT